MKPKAGDKIRFRKDDGKVLAFYEYNGFYVLNFKGKKFSHAWTRLTEKDIAKIEKV